MRPVRIGAQVVRDSSDDVGCGGEGGARRDRKVEDGPGPLLGFVADAVDLPVGDVPDRPLDVAEPGDAEAHRLDGAGDGWPGAAGGDPNVDDVADPELVLEEHERPG